MLSVRQLAGDALCRADTVAVQLGEPVDEPAALVAEILRQVDDLHACGHRVRLHPFAALTVCRTEEQHVDGSQVVSVAETHFGVALQSPVYVGEAVARVARAVDEDDPGLRVGEQQADQFAGGVPGASDDAGPDHFLLRFWTLW